MKSPVLFYGLLGGLLISLLFLGPIVIAPGAYTEADQMVSSEIFGYSVMILSMLTVYFGIRQSRNNNPDTRYSFGKGLITGLKITIVACAVFYLGNVLLYEVIAPDFLAEFSDYYLQNLIENAGSEVERQKIMADFEATAFIIESSYAYAALMSASALMIGLVISLISSLILMRRS